SALPTQRRCKYWANAAFSRRCLGTSTVETCSFRRESVHLDAAGAGGETRGGSIPIWLPLPADGLCDARFGPCAVADRVLVLCPDHLVVLFQRRRLLFRHHVHNFVATCLELAQQFGAWPPLWRAGNHASAECPYRPLLAEL